MSVPDAAQMRDAYSIHYNQRTSEENVFEVPVSGIRSTTSPPALPVSTAPRLAPVRVASPPLSISAAPPRFIPKEKVEVSGRSSPENLAAAERLRFLLQAGIHPEPPAPVPQPLRTDPTTLVGQAFQREYHPSLKFRHLEHLDKGDQDVGDRFLLVGEALSGSQRGREGSTITYASSRRDSVYDRAYQYLSRRGSTSGDRDRKGLVLPGLGEGRQRNGYGRALTGGQESGQGVIGSTTTHSARSALMSQDTVIIDSENGCDIPMTRNAVSGEDYITTSVSLDPDLPPLAIEHPARVWNSLLHSLSADRQPIIKWEYEKARKEGAGILWVAHLTLILPPTHPSIANHPLASTLSKNRYSKEYITAAEVLGGVKSWSGIGRVLKADAQNTTLAQCVADDALSWVLDPILNDIPEEEDAEDRYITKEPDYEIARQDLSGVVARWAESIEQDDSPKARPLKGEELTPLFGANELSSDAPQKKDVTINTQITSDLQNPASGEIKMEVIDDGCPDTISPRIAHAQEESSDDDDIQQNEAGLGKSQAAHLQSGEAIDYPATATLNQALTKWSSMTTASVFTMKIYSSNKNSQAVLLGGTMTIGIAPHIQLYEVSPIHATAEQVKEELCQLALSLNALGFMAWLGGIKTPPPEAINDALPVQDDTCTRVARVLRKVEDDRDSQGEIDWQNQLSHFCAQLKIRYPRFDYTVGRDEHGQVTFIGQVTVGNEQFTAPFGKPTIDQARQYVARKVFTDHFGQTPKSIPAYKKRTADDQGGRTDVGRKRGGGNGRRGRGRGASKKMAYRG